MPPQMDEVEGRVAGEMASQMEQAILTLTDQSLELMGGLEQFAGSSSANPKPGDTVVLTGVPSGLPDGLPSEDQTAIVEAVGKPVLLVGYEDGRAELEFTDDHGTIHSIYVHPSFIRAVS